MKHLVLALILMLVMSPANAGERAIYDASGKLVARSYTSRGETKLYDASGKLIGRVVEKKR